MQREIIFIFFFLMAITEEILARFIFLFLKHLTIELSHLIIVKNNHQLPKKSILRKSYDKTLSFNQNNSLLSSFQTESLNNRRKVSFTHVDSFEFDPQIPSKFLGLPQREQFYLSTNDQQMQCLCHHYSKINLKNKCKIKLKRQQR